MRGSPGKDYGQSTFAILALLAVVVHVVQKLLAGEFVELGMEIVFAGIIIGVIALMLQLYGRVTA